MPASSSSAARWNSSVPAGSTPARTIAAAAASAAAIGPFMSADPASDSRPSSIVALPRVRAPRCRASRPARRRGVRSTPGVGRAPEPIAATTLGRPASERIVVGRRAEPGEDLGGDRGGLVLGAAGVLAGRRDQRSREREDLVRIDGGARAALGGRSHRSLPWRAMLHAADLATALQRGARPRSHDRSRRPGSASPPCWRSSSMAGARPWCSPCARRRCPGTPARSRSRADCRIRASRSSETALRETHEEIGLDPSLPDVVGALPPVHTFVSGILVVPFVGRAGRRCRRSIVSDAEIDEVLTFPVARLAAVERADGATTGRTAASGEGSPTTLDGHTIWGATGWMLHALLETIRKETTWAIP